jgi:hypothetical protein
LVENVFCEVFQVFLLLHEIVFIQAAVVVAEEISAPSYSELATIEPAHKFGFALVILIHGIQSFHEQNRKIVHQDYFAPGKADDLMIAFAVANIVEFDAVFVVGDNGFFVFGDFFEDMFFLKIRHNSLMAEWELVDELATYHSRPMIAMEEFLGTLAQEVVDYFLKRLFDNFAAHCPSS